MKNALVIGGARSGKYIALLLNDDNYNVTLTDINNVDYKEELQEVGINVVDNGHPDTLFDTKYDLVIMNPGIKYSAPFIQKVLAHNYRIYNEIEIALNYAPSANVLAISGTNGKTTTVTMLYEMMNMAYDNVYLGGNIGVPVSQIVYENSQIDHLIIEVSSFQLDGFYNFKPNTAALTNLKPDHLDYYENVSAYYTTKQKLYKNQTADNYLIVNKDDDIVLKYLNEVNAKVIEYSLNSMADVYLDNDNIMYKDIVLFSKSDLKVVGKHNLYNATLASIMAYVNNVSSEVIKQVLNEFKGVEHRIEYVDSKNNVMYYNDSKATNIESLIVALEAFEKPVILIAGGYDKKVSFDDLIKYNDKIKKAILFGGTKYELANIFNNNIIVEDLEYAVKVASEISEDGDIVLFSPACASFDQFKDYEQRGRLFKQYVTNIKSVNN